MDRATPKCPYRAMLDSESDQQVMVVVDSTILGHVHGRRLQVLSRVKTHTDYTVGYLRFNCWFRIERRSAYFGQIFLCSG